MNIITEQATVQASITEVFNFLSDAKNFEIMLPMDKISYFKADEFGCSFKAQGGIIIPLLFENKEPFQEIKMKSGEKAPFPYTLSILLKENDENSCLGHIEFEANINMFMKMMVEKPLSALFEVMTKNLQKHFA